MLASPTHAVLGATDLAATVAFLGLLGFVEVARTERSGQHLYDVTAVTEVELAVPGTTTGRIVVVSGAVGPGARTGFDRGAQALDVYTRDTAATLVLLDAHHGPTGHVVLGPVVMDQTWVHGPDVPLVLIQSDKRRASVLDSTDGLHSEAHSVVWSVDDIEAVGAWWREATGLSLPMVFGFADAQVCSFMELPRDDVPISMCMLSDADNHPVRLELLEFTADGGRTHADLPLRGGVHAVRFTVTDVTSVAATLAAAGATVGDVVDGSCTFTSPGGVRGQLVEGDR